jgi:hypothetical protein
MTSSPEPNALDAQQDLLPTASTAAERPVDTPNPWIDDGLHVRDAHGLSVSLCLLTAHASQIVREHNAHSALSDTLSETLAALRDLNDQVNQMRGMFSDEDGAIRRAQRDALDALKNGLALLSSIRRAIPAKH